MKKTLSILLIFVFMTLSIGIIPANASEIEVTSENVSIEYLSNGYYIETVIEDVPSICATTSTITKTKTSYCKNSSGTVLWYVSITGTFNYDGSTSTCTSCSHSASAPASTWTIKSSSCSRSGNSATAVATAIQHLTTTTAEFSMSVTISCSPNGTIS